MQYWKYTSTKFKSHPTTKKLLKRGGGGAKRLNECNVHYLLQTLNGIDMLFGRRFGVTGERECTQSANCFIMEKLYSQQQKSDLHYSTRFLFKNLAPFLQEIK